VDSTQGVGGVSFESANRLAKGVMVI